MYLAVGWGFPVDMILVRRDVRDVRGQFGVDRHKFLLDDPKKKRRFRREIQSNSPSARTDGLGGLTESNDIVSRSVHDGPK